MCASPEIKVGSVKPNPERPLRMTVDFPEPDVPMTATTMGLPEEREDNCWNFLSKTQSILDKDFAD